MEPFRFVDAWRAYIACRRGKRRTKSAQRYAAGVFDRLTDTVDALASGMWKPSAAQAFIVTRPKAREVLAAAFGDRVVHHLLVPHLERQFEPVFIHDAWSNRIGKGIHAAVARLRGFMQSLSDNGAKCLVADGLDREKPGGLARAHGRAHEPHFLQLDIANFFNRIDRRILFDLLRRRLERDALRAVDDPRHVRPDLAARLLWLCRRLLTGNAAEGARLLGESGRFDRVPAHKRLINAPDGKGLPIGNLTSQFFANVYLNELDQFVKHRLKCRHYLRYVDDFVLLAPDRPTLEAWRDAIRTFLRERLELELRDAGRIAPIVEGVDFLGYRVRGSHLIVRPRVVGHCIETLDRWQDRWVRETARATVYDLAPVAREALAATVASYGAHFRHASDGRLWRRLRARCAVLPLLFDTVAVSGVGAATTPPSRRFATPHRALAGSAAIATAGGVCRPNWAAPADAGLAGQWRYFRRQCGHWFPRIEGWQSENFRPWLLLMQVGRDVEVYADDARRIAAARPEQGGRAVWRRGLGDGLAWPLRRLPALFGLAARLGWHVAWVEEQGYRRRAGKRRVLRRLVVAKHSAPLSRLRIAAEAVPTNASLMSCGSGLARDNAAACTDRLIAAEAAPRQTSPMPCCLTTRLPASPSYTGNQPFASNKKGRQP